MEDNDQVANRNKDNLKMIKNCSFITEMRKIGKQVNREDNNNIKIPDVLNLTTGNHLPVEKNKDKDHLNIKEVTTGITLERS